MYQYIEYGYIWKLSTPAPVCVLFLKEQIPYKLQLVRLCLIDSLVRPRAATALLGGVEVRRLLLVVRLYLPRESSARSLFFAYCGDTKVAELLGDGPNVG